MREITVAAINRKGTVDKAHRIKIDKNIILNKQLFDFVSEDSISICTTNNNSVKFTKKDPSSWENDPEFIEAKRTVKSWNIVNDLAERVIALT
ncbi:Hypothetical protein CINCED_3A020352 [Cinara cedri]|uniref:Uncharacterized protein n=1 Tax=Cinara cedri TaxID=506608 RepID=A0A5E4MW29_9HEMI|nr:Hypothetical protein CINCED_3A020352 [Cinara cedri]